MVCLQIINKILKSKSLDIVISNDLTESHFIGFEAYYNFIMEHYRKYGNVPDIATFLSNFEDFEILDVTESDKYLVDTCREEYLYSRLVPILEESASILTNKTSEEALDFLKANLITMTPETTCFGIDIIKDAHLRYEEYIAKQTAETPWMISTGFKALDDIIGGYARGEEFVVVVARTNQGKSWILSKTAEHMWSLGLNIGYISPEMTANAIGYRFDTLHEHFSNSALYKGLPVEHYKEYIDDLASSDKNAFWVATPLDFNRKITITKLRNFCQKCKLDVLLIDGITYLSDERYKRGDNKTTSLTNLSEDLMQLSVELKIPVLVVVQANRSATGPEATGTPELESIRDSDGIAMNATKVLSIRQNNGNLIMSVKKNRNGPVNVDMAYSWNIDTGDFEYNSRYNEYNESTETTSSYSNKNSKPVENKQPIRRATQEQSDVPIGSGSIAF